MPLGLYSLSLSSILSCRGIILRQTLSTQQSLARTGVLYYHRTESHWIGLQLHANPWTVTVMVMLMVPISRVGRFRSTKTTCTMKEKGVGPQMKMHQKKGKWTLSRTKNKCPPDQLRIETPSIVWQWRFILVSYIFLVTAICLQYVWIDSSA